MFLDSRIIDLALAARLIGQEELLPLWEKIRSGKVALESHSHADGSLYSEADSNSERRLIDVAKIIYPEAYVTGEEEICDNPEEILGKLAETTAIIFDPLDGSTAFIEGRPDFAIMGAVIVNGDTKAGFIYSPVRDETIVVEKGNGCWSYRGDKISNPSPVKISQRPVTLTDHARVAFACRNQDSHYENILAQGMTGAQERWHANHDYWRILFNESDATFYAEGFLPNGVGKCPPWDHAAGILAIQEAGGYAALPYGKIDLQGTEYKPLACHSSLLVTANRELFTSITQHVAQIAPELLKPR